MMKRYLTLLSCFAPVIMNLSLRAQNAGESGFGRLEVSVIDAYGQRVQGAEISVQRNGESGRISLNERPNELLPFGLYTVDVKASGFRPVSLRVNLNARLVPTLACLRLAAMHSFEPVLQYAKVPMRSGNNKCSQVVVLPLFCGTSDRNQLIAVPLNGSFVIEKPEAGRYVAVSVSPEEACDQTVFDITAQGVTVILPTR